MTSRILSILSSSKLRVSALMFRYVVHFDFSLIDGKRHGPHSVLCRDKQFSQHHVLNRLSFLQPVFSAPLSNVKELNVSGVVFGPSLCPTDPHVCFGAMPCLFFISLPLWYNLKSGIVMPPAVLLLTRITFATLGLFLSQVNFGVVCFGSTRNAVGILTGVVYFLRIWSFYFPSWIFQYDYYGLCSSSFCAITRKYLGKEKRII